MVHDGGYTLRYGDRTETLTHVQGAALCREFNLSQRIPHSTREGARNTLPMAVLDNILLNMRVDDAPLEVAALRNGLMRRVAEERILRHARGATTEATLIAHDMAHDTVTGVRKSRRSGTGFGTDPTDDPVLTRLLGMHGVTGICRPAPGVDLFWGGLEEQQTSFGDANPYHRLTGLPPSLPPLLMRSAWKGRPACVAVSLGDGGDGALYCQEGGYAWLGTTRRLSDTVLVQLPGRPVTDLVGHDALQGWVIDAPFDHHPDDAAYAPTAYNLRWAG